ncbi:Hypothetical predicted protein [Lecanosticta acicola]|uniref:Uncharacterized protein n=1 Tax=Lecanosticta acicola TaxID=111012 RepID=A0AAI8Z910_9PEZI|nr:Hypothetical predicted protein [Lecanosticta acicola]
MSTTPNNTTTTTTTTTTTAETTQTYRSPTQPTRANNAPRFNAERALSEINSQICERVRNDGHTSMPSKTEWEQTGKHVALTWHACKQRFNQYGIHNMLLLGKDVPAWYLRNSVDRAGHPDGEKEKELVGLVENGSAVPFALVWECRIWLERECFVKKAAERRKLKAKEKGKGESAVVDQDADTQDANTQNADTKDANIQDADTQDADIQDADTEDTDIQEKEDDDDFPDDPIMLRDWPERIADAEEDVAEYEAELEFVNRRLDEVNKEYRHLQDMLEEMRGDVSEHVPKDLWPFIRNLG